MGRKADPQIRERILQEAEHLIHLRGFHGTTMDDIAKSCKMTKANLFHHYESKEDLGLAVLDSKIGDYRRGRMDPLCGCDDPLEAVDRLFREAGKFFGGNGCKAGCLVANIALEMSDINEGFRKRASGFFAEWAKGVAECLAAAKARGYFGATLDPKAAAEAVVSLYEGGVMLSRAHRDPSVMGRVGKAARQLLSQHLRQRARRIKMGPKTPCGC
jgi:AcrR family transcriptional regulator